MKPDKQNSLALAIKWGCDATTIRRWRASGAPVDLPGWRAMSAWLASRDHVGKGTWRALQALHDADPVYQLQRARQAAAERRRASRREQAAAADRTPTTAEEHARVVAEWHRDHDKEEAERTADFYVERRPSFATQEAWRIWCEQAEAYRKEMNLPPAPPERWLNLKPGVYKKSKQNKSKH